MLTLIIVSRGRPDKFKRAIESARKMAAQPVHVITYVDNDDPKRDEYLSIPNIEVHLGPRIYSARAILVCLSSVVTEYAFLGADDIEFMSQDWDMKLIEAMPEDNLAIVYGTDDYKCSCDHFLFSMKWHRLVGLFPNIFDHMGPDHWVRDVAEKLDRKIQVRDVFISHKHWKNGQAELDSTYMEAREKGVPRTLLSYTEPVRDRCVEILRENMG